MELLSSENKSGVVGLILEIWMLLLVIHCGNLENVFSLSEPQFLFEKWQKFGLLYWFVLNITLKKMYM